MELFYREIKKRFSAVSYSLPQNVEEGLSVHRVICLLQYDLEIKLSLLPPAHLLQESAEVDDRGLELLEVGVVDLECKEMWSLFVHIRQDGLLHDLGDVGSHHNGADLVESHRSSPRLLL